MLNPIRAALYALLFPLSVVLLGLTGYRIHYTKGLGVGDILTSRRHFYDPIIVELLVTSVLAMLFSCWFMAAILGKLRNPLSKYISEHTSLFIIWVMFLVGAAITTHKWLHLKYCRGSYKVCRILETIKAFAWMCFIITTFLLLASLISMLTRKRTPTDHLHGEDGYGSYPAETRQARAGGTTTTAYNNVQPTTHVATGGVGTGAGTGTGTTTTTTAGTTGTVPHNATANVHTHEV